MGKAQPDSMQPAKVDDSSEKSLAVRQIAMQTHFHSGPLPSADEFAMYERAVPGAGNRILAMAEQQGSHRRQLEAKDQSLTSRDSLIGMIFAFIFAMTALGGAIFLTYTDHPVAGTIIGGTGLLAVVSAFIQGRNPKTDN